MGMPANAGTQQYFAKTYLVPLLESRAIKTSQSARSLTDYTIVSLIGWADALIGQGLNVSGSALILNLAQKLFSPLGVNFIATFLDCPIFGETIAGKRHFCFAFLGWRPPRHPTATGRHTGRWKLYNTECLTHINYEEQSMFAPNIPKQLRKNSIIFANLGAALVCLNVAAETQIAKPGEPTLASQFGSRVVQFENYTLASSFQDALRKVNEPAPRAEESQGSVHVFENGGTTPKASYQFPGAINAFKQVGTQIAMSKKWIAFTATNVFGQATNNTVAMQPAQVFIVGKDANGQWKTCATPAGEILADCTGNVDVNGQANTGKALKSIDFELTDIEIANGYDFQSARNMFNQSIAISDNYLAIANTAKGVVTIYRYDAVQNQWLQDWRYDAPDEEKFGTSMAIEGDRIVISAPGLEGDAGRIYTLQRDNVGNFWSWQGLWSNPDPSVKNFGISVDMHSNRVLVGGNTPFGTTKGNLAFFKWGTYGLVQHNFFATPDPVVSVTLNGTMAGALFLSNLSWASTYRLDTATDKWMESNRTYVDNVSPVLVPQTDGTVFERYFYPRSMDIHSGNLVFGWPSKPISSVSLVGALVLNAADSCLWDTNLIKGCNFDPMKDWSFGLYNGGGGWVNYGNKNMQVNISNPGTQTWHIQARYPLNLTKSGSYILSFKARATAARNLEISLGRNGGAYANYAVKSIPLTTSMQYFSYQLDNIPVDSAARLDFNFGRAGTAQVTVDEVSLIPIVPNRF